MNLSVGIVGLPNVGKSTLFNTLTKQEINVANYPFATIDPNVGIVQVPDMRLKRLAELNNSKKVIPAVVEFYDIAGLVKGANKGEGLGNQFLSHIREVSAIIEVVRCFKNEEIIHVEAEVNPERDIDIINTELELKDLESSEEVNLLSRKPKIYLLNGNERDISVELIKKITNSGSSYIIADLSSSSSVPELIKESYKLLNLISYFTTGAEETRAWTVKKGTKAPDAAGVIHDDFKKLFIRAEVISTAELLNCGSWQNARANGKIRIEGKDYIVADGDVMYIRHG